MSYICIYGEVTEEYHNELYGFLEFQHWFNDYKKGRPKGCYLNAKTQKTSDLVLTEYIRHQIHHPENHSNAPFTMNELKQSIEDMRNYIQDHMKAEKISESVADIE